MRHSDKSITGHIRVETFTGRLLIARSVHEMETSTNKRDVYSCSLVMDLWSLLQYSFSFHRQKRSKEIGTFYSLRIATLSLQELYHHQKLSHDIWVIYFSAIV